MILVTGATGFLGAELVRQLLIEAEKVRCIKRSGSVIPKILIPLAQKIEWVDADILDFSALEDAFENVLQVYHCAAMVSFNKKDREVMMSVNVIGTENIVNLCLENKVHKLVHVSSVAALGNVKPGEGVNENVFWDAYDKNGNYAVSKYRSEMEVWRGINEGLNAVIVNPSVIIGENVGETGSAKLFKLVADGLDYYTAGNIGLVDVLDVARCMILLMKSEISGERFLINADTFSYQRFFTEVATAFGIAAPRKSISKPLLMMISRIGAVSRLFFKSRKGLTKETVNAAFNQSVYNNHKIKDVVGIQFIPVKDSIVNTVKGLKGDR